MIYFHFRTKVCHACLSGPAITISLTKILWEFDGVESDREVVGQMIWTDRFYTVVASCCSVPAVLKRLIEVVTYCSLLQLYNAGHMRHLSRKSKRLDAPLFSGHLMTSGILGIILVVLSQIFVFSVVIAQIKVKWVALNDKISGY